MLVKSDDMISIVIPVYNKEKYLLRCIKSILNQSYKDIEIIMVDDGSTDGSGNLCDIISRSYRVATTIHQKNQGPYAARTRGALKAKGEWTMFVDADDLLLPEALLRLCHYMDIDCDLISGNLLHQGIPFNQKINNKVDKLTYIKAMLIGETNIGPYCKLFRTYILKQSLGGGGTLPRNIRQNEDLYMNIQYACNMKGYLYMDKKLVCYQYNDIPKALSKSGLMTLNNWVILFEHINSLLSELKSSSIKRAFISYQLRIIHTIMIYGDETLSSNNDYVRKLLTITNSLGLNDSERHTIYLINHKWMQHCYHIKRKIKYLIKTAIGK